MNEPLHQNLDVRRGPASSITPRGQDLASIALVAVALRVVLIVASLTWSGMSFRGFMSQRDGASFMAYAHMLLGHDVQLAEYDYRVFPGYPALLAAGSLTGASMPVVALVINLLSVGLAAVFAAALFQNRWIGWAMAILTPSYLLFSSHAMGEPANLALILAGLLLAVRSPHLTAVAIGGVLLGYAGLIRPVACFAVAGFMVWAILQRRWRPALIHGAVAAAFVAAGLALLQWRTGHALHSLEVYKTHEQAYAGQLFTWPFRSIIHSTLVAFDRDVMPNIPPKNLVYIWLHIVIVVAGCVVPFLIRPRSADGGKHPLFWVAMPWLWGNTLFVLCIGHYWGMLEFARFIIPALPPLFLAYERLLPRGKAWWLWLPLAALSWIVAFEGITNFATHPWK